MAADFTCPKCGEHLSVQAAMGAKVRCPYCGGKVKVPADAGGTGLQASSDAVPPPDQSQSAPERVEAVFDILATAMPWVISAFLHGGVVLIMMFVTMLVIEHRIPEEVIVPQAVLADRDPGPMAPFQEKHITPQQRDQSVTRRTHHRTAAAETGRTQEKLLLIGTGTSGAGALAPVGLPGPGGAPVKFFGTSGGGNVHHVVYVVDRSGSMATGERFDTVRHEILVSISRLKEVQDFHVILFSTGAPIENPPKRLVGATRAAKKQVAKFLGPVLAFGQTDPVPALNRAFAVLDRAGKRPGKLICLLTDGEFPDNAAVLAAVAKKNADKKVRINTYLHDYRHPMAVEVMKDIATQNGGQYKYISPDE